MCLRVLNRGRVCYFSKREDDLIVMQNVLFKFRQVCDIISCSENICGRYCTWKSEKWSLSHVIRHYRLQDKKVFIFCCLE